MTCTEALAPRVRLSARAWELGRGVVPWGMGFMFRWTSEGVAAVPGGANGLTARRSTAARSASNLHAFFRSVWQRPSAEGIDDLEWLHLASEALRFLAGNACALEG
jgi:hypothetical protein